jgi:aryl-alcohol dehydrogenase-like predicted oxidoreductase/histidinol phosphatase-like enzyme/predicted kinase
MRSPTIGLGCMRLSTERDRDEMRALAVLHAAFDAGVTMVDTADAYCWDDSEIGHNERLVAQAVATWAGDRTRLQIATKGGLTRPEGRWSANGRAKHLAAACARSCRALAVDRIHLYQLHAPDPQTPLATSVRALAALQRDGLIEHIGLCNVTVGQIEQARRIVDIDAVQVELSVWHDAQVLSGVVDYCITHRIRMLAYRPLGGAARRHRTATHPTLKEVGARHGATPFEIALAWLMDLSDRIVPVAGATRIETAQSTARARSIALTDQDRAELDDRFPHGRTFRAPATTQVVPALRSDVDLVLVMGLPGAGKSSYVSTLAAQGYQRLSRDESGGTLRELLPALDVALSAGATRIALDNTYVSRKARAEVIQAVRSHGVPVRCVWLATSVEDAQVNAVLRLISRYGHLPADAELARLRKRDVAAFLPSVQFRYQRELEPPDAAEGFTRVDVIPFERHFDPSNTGRALILWCDGVLLRSRAGHRVPLTPDDVEVAGDRAATLARHRDEGWRLLGMAWRPEIAEGMQTEDDAQATFARMNELLGVSIEVAWCPHGPGPPRCWCRKPLPGLGVLFVHRHRLDPAQCIYVGDGPQDPGFARRLGFRYREARSFFEDG